MNKDRKKIYHNDSLKRYLWVSIAIHIAALIVFSGILDFGSDEIILPQAMKVDIIGRMNELPTVPTPAKPSPAEGKQPEAKPEKKLPVKESSKTTNAPKVNLEKKKKLKIKKKKQVEEKRKKKLEQEKKLKDNQLSALRKLKQSAALDKLKKTAPQEPVKPIKGNRISSGSFSDGLDSIQFDKYYSDLKTHLFQNWSIPGWLSELDLKAQALVVLNSKGYVIRREIIKTSGNLNFDNTILAAIDRSSPFPLPPDRLSSRVEKKEIVFGFPKN